jgi:hypothetical protein
MPTRKLFSSFLLPTLAAGSTFATYHNVNTTSADAKFSAATDHGKGGSENLSQTRAKDLLRQQKAVKLQTRMTAIGKFSLKTETPTNPSVPVFFMALSSKPGRKNEESAEDLRSKVSINDTIDESPLTPAKFEKRWVESKMHEKHPRFSSKVTKDGNFFEPITTPRTIGEMDTTSHSSTGEPLASLRDHILETLHMNVYREDLKSRIEKLVTSAMDVNHKLWEVQISSGDLGSSGAISQARSEEIKADYDDYNRSRSGADTHNHKPKETVLLFRCHHSLGDAVSLTAALGDLLDEAAEIRDMIKAEIKRRRDKKGKQSALRKLLAFFQKLIWLLFGSITVLTRQLYLMVSTKKNPFCAVLNKSQKELDEMAVELGRSVSWCDVAPVDEARRVAKSLGGPKATINDVFVSCVTAAIARQLAEHRKNSGYDERSSEVDLQRHFNVVVPAHLTGGILPPGQSVGNHIGAFVAKVPGEMENATASPSERLALVHQSLDLVKRSPAPIVSYCIARFSSSCLPQSLATRLFHRGSANAAVAVTNSRGFEKKVHMNGSTIESMAGFIPLPPGLPVGVVVQSYGSKISVSVNAEKWAVPDADVFLGWILEEYSLLCKENELKL